MRIRISEAARQDLIDGHRVEHDTIRVYAVLDCRRDPAWIRDRLR